MTGRPSTFSQEVFDAICERISRGEPLAAICRDEGMPGRNTVYDWMAGNEALAGQFARAREKGFDAIAEQCLEIADDESHDWALSKKGPVIDEVAIARARLRVETRLKLLAKWDPKRYGDKLEVDNKGELTVNVTVKRFTPENAA